MGCPPDPYEIEGRRRDVEGLAHEERYVALVAESRRTAEIAEKLLAGESERKTLVRALRTAIDDLARCPPKPLTPGMRDYSGAERRYETRYGDALMKLMYQVDDLAAERKELETRLCIARDALLRLARETGKLPKLAKEEEKLHLAHRRDDVETRAKVLEDELTTLRYRIEKDEGPRWVVEAHIARKQVKISRIRALTDDELLASRDL